MVKLELCIGADKCRQGYLLCPAFAGVATKYRPVICNHTSLGRSDHAIPHLQSAMESGKPAFLFSASSRTWTPKSILPQGPYDVSNNRVCFSILPYLP